MDSYTALRDTFDTMPSTLEKEHCLMCMRFEFNGRSGVLLCDPGYHVARVVTVMDDRAYPHTGKSTTYTQKQRQLFTHV